MKYPVLRVQAPLYGSSGYANAAREFLLALAERDAFPISVDRLKWLSGFDIQESRARYLALRALEQVAYTPGKNLLLHWSIASEFAGRQGESRAIGHAIFETSSLIKSFVAGCNRMDAVMVPSSFHAEAFQTAGVEVPIEVIPEGVNTERFTPNGSSLKTVPERFTFLCVSQLSYRKGFDLVLKAFLELFANHDDVQLLLRCYLHDGSPKDLQQVAQFIRVFRDEEMGGLKEGHIYLLDNIPDIYLPAMYRSAHVLLAPFRGEGWGLPIMESLASEIPVIATHWGGPATYLNSEIATLLDYKLCPIPAQVPELFLGKHLIQARQEGHLLAEPDYQQLKYAMWDAYQNYFLHKAKAIDGRRYLKKNYHWKHAAEKFIDWANRL